MYIKQMLPTSSSGIKGKTCESTGFSGWTEYSQLLMNQIGCEKTEAPL